ncbi:hypothetical protein ACFL60_09160, partial [Candidatus Omnitrophota bacterium]
SIKYNVSRDISSLNLIKVDEETKDISIKREEGAEKEDENQPYREKAGWDTFNSADRFIRYSFYDGKILKDFKVAAQDSHMPEEYKEIIGNTQKAIGIYEVMEKTFPGPDKFELDMISIFVDRDEAIVNIEGGKDEGWVADYIRYTQSGDKDGQDTYEYNLDTNVIGRKIYISFRDLDFNISFIIDWLSANGFKDTDIVRDLKGGEVYHVIGLDPDEETPITTWTSIFKKAEDKELIKIDKDKDDLSLDVIIHSKSRPYIEIGSIQFLYKEIEDTDGNVNIEIGKPNLKKKLAGTKGISIVFGEEDGNELRLVHEPEEAIHYLEAKKKTDGAVEDKYECQYGEKVKIDLELLLKLAEMDSGDRAKLLETINDDLIRKEREHLTYKEGKTKQGKSLSKTYLRRLGIAKETETVILRGDDQDEVIKSRSELPDGVMELYEGMIRLHYDRWDSGADDDGIGRIHEGIKHTRETKENGKRTKIDFLNGIQDILLYNSEYGDYGIADKSIRVTNKDYLNEDSVWTIYTISNNTLVDDAGRNHFVIAELNTSESKREPFRKDMTPEEVHALYFSDKVIALNGEIKNNEGEDKTELIGYNTVKGKWVGEDGNPLSDPAYIVLYPDYDDFGYSSGPSKQRYDREQFGIVNSPEFLKKITEDVQSSNIERPNELLERIKAIVPFTDWQSIAYNRVFERGEEAKDNRIKYTYEDKAASDKDIYIRPDGGVDREYVKSKKWGLDYDKKVSFDLNGFPVKVHYTPTDNNKMHDTTLSRIMRKGSQLKAPKLYDKELNYLNIVFSEYPGYVLSIEIDPSKGESRTINSEENPFNRLDKARNEIYGATLSFNKIIIAYTELDLIAHVRDKDTLSAKPNENMFKRTIKTVKSNSFVSSILRYNNRTMTQIVQAGLAIALATFVFAMIAFFAFIKNRNIYKKIRRWITNEPLGGEPEEEEAARRDVQNLRKDAKEVVSKAKVLLGRLGTGNVVLRSIVFIPSLIFKPVWHGLKKVLNPKRWPIIIVAIGKRLPIIVVAIVSFMYRGSATVAATKALLISIYPPLILVGLVAAVILVKFWRSRKKVGINKGDIGSLAIS